MSPAAIAAIKHTLALYVGQVYWFAPRFSAKWLACQLQPMSGQFLLDVYGHNYIWRKWAIPGLFMRYFRPFKTIPADVTNKRENIWRLDLNRRPVDFDSPPLATRPLPLEGGKEPNRGTRYETVWPDKNRQMSIKVTQKWFHQENEWFWHLFKNCLTMWAIWV